MSEGEAWGTLAGASECGVSTYRDASHALRVEAAEHCAVWLRDHRGPGKGRVEVRVVR